MGLGVELTGSWRAAIDKLRILETRAGKALENAIVQEAHAIRADIVKGLDSGRGFVAHAPATLFLRRATGAGKGSKILIASAAMRAAVVVIRTAGGAFVGVSRGAPRGRYRISEIQERGANINVTPRMRRFLHAMLRRGGAQPSAGMGRVTIRIPPRPFVGPVVAALQKSGRLERRIAARVKAELGV